MSATNPTASLLTQVVTADVNKALELVQTEPRGLSSAETAGRLAQYGRTKYGWSSAR